MSLVEDSLKYTYIGWIGGVGEIMRLLQKPGFHWEKVFDKENPGLALNFPLTNSKCEFPLKRLFTRRYAVSAIRGENWCLSPGFSETGLVRSNIDFFNTLIMIRDFSY